MMQNCRTSVSVIDHMPPTTEYRTTTPPASSMATVGGRPRITLKTVPMAMVEVTAIISA